MTSNYEVIKVVGEGSYGKALLARRRNDNLQCILKQISITKLSKQEAMFTKQEASLLSKLNHPNIVTFIESFTTPNSVYIVMEFADRGDLSKLIRDQKGRFFHENIVTDVFLQMSLGLKHIHDRKILHRDLKTANIFLTKSGQVKIGDFGVSRVLRNTGELAKTVIGTPLYMSPEILDNKNYNSKSDIWSMGCILYELMCLRLPFNGKSMPELCRNIMLSSYVQPPSHYSAELRQLLKEMLSKNPNERPGINSVLAKPILKSQISKHLKEAEVNEEFSHTLIHGGDILRGNIDKLIAENYKKKSNNNNNNNKIINNGIESERSKVAQDSEKQPSSAPTAQQRLGAAIPVVKPAPEHKVVVDNFFRAPVPTKPPPKVRLQSELKPPPPPPQPADKARYILPENRPIGGLGGGGGEAAPKRLDMPRDPKEKKARDRPWAQPVQPKPSTPKAAALKAPLKKVPSDSKIKEEAAVRAAAAKPSHLFLRRAELKEGGKFKGLVDVDPGAAEPIPDSPDSSDDEAPLAKPAPAVGNVEKKEVVATPTPVPADALKNNWLSQLEMQMGDLRGQLQGMKIKSPLVGAAAPSPVPESGKKNVSTPTPTPVALVVVPQVRSSDKKGAPAPSSRTPLSVARAAAAAKLTPKEHNHIIKKPISSTKKPVDVDMRSVSEPSPSPKEALAVRKQRRDEEREALRDFLRQQRKGTPAPEAFPLDAGDEHSAATPPAAGDKRLKPLAPSTSRNKVSKGLPSQSPSRAPASKRTSSPAAAAVPARKRSADELKADREAKREELRRMIAERKQALQGEAPIEIRYGPAGDKYIATSSTDAPLDAEVETEVEAEVETEVEVEVEERLERERVEEEYAQRSTNDGMEGCVGSTLADDMDAEAQAVSTCCNLLSQCFSAKTVVDTSSADASIGDRREGGRGAVPLLGATLSTQDCDYSILLSQLQEIMGLTSKQPSDDSTAAESVSTSSHVLYDDEEFEEEEVDINALVGDREFEADCSDFPVDEVEEALDELALEGGGCVGVSGAQDEVFEFSELSSEDDKKEEEGVAEEDGGRAREEEVAEEQQDDDDDDGVVVQIEEVAEVEEEAMSDFSDEAVEELPPAAALAAERGEEASKLWAFLAPRVGETRLREATAFLSSLGDEDDKDEEYLAELEAIVGSACIKYLDLMFQLTMAMAKRP